MKVLLLSDTFSEHTEKWALGLADKGVQIGIFSFNKASYEWYTHKNITVFFEPETNINAESTFTKLSYLKYVTILKRIIKHFKPDILHAHYATSYGLIGALSGFHPFILSVWGADVYDFPSRSKLHKKVFQYNLKKANVILSTSHIMKEEVRKYTSKEVVVTPFGVDVQKFSKRDFEGKDKSVTHIGTIKPIEEKYGIIYIIDAAKLVIERNPEKKFKFYLIGSGSDLDGYRKMIKEKELEDHFIVTGRIPFSEISNYHNLLDIFLNVSIDDSESFGVATVEAMSCERPVIVTDVGGLMEVVDHGKFGIVIPKKNSVAMADAIDKLVNNQEEARELGLKARKSVLDRYDWNGNLQQMIDIYNSTVSKK
jgi:glycosyltransferase involved in cell wall biosynthesis